MHRPSPHIHQQPPSSYPTSLQRLTINQVISKRYRGMPFNTSLSIRSLQYDRSIIFTQINDAEHLAAADTKEAESEEIDDNKDLLQ